MIEPIDIDTLDGELRACVLNDRELLEKLRRDVRRLRSGVRRIHPHATTAISLVGTDGGNNQVQFDPFMVQLVRVVDSSNNEYCLEVVTPTSNLAAVARRHLGENGNTRTLLGKMMSFLGVQSLHE